MNKEKLAIENPKKMLGEEIFMVNTHPIKDAEPGYGKNLGSVLSYSAVDAIEVVTIELADNKTAVVYNIGTPDVIRIPTNRPVTISEATYFEDEEDSQEIAKELNEEQLIVGEELEGELGKALKFIQELVQKGA